MRLAYFDCFSGISGDMALGALVHAGADLKVIAETLGTFPIEGFLLEREDVDAQGIAATRIHIRSRPQEVIRTYAAMRSTIEQSDLPDDARRMAHRMYRRLAEASARIHGKEVELVTFHEFGDVDCLVEIVGSALALHLLGVERVFASPVPTGLGMVRTEHGVTPIPSPVVMELLQGVPTYSRGIPVELVTATGAAILAAVSEGWGDMPLMRADQVGYGAGHLRLDFPNVLRVLVGDEEPAGRSAATGPERSFLVQSTLPDLKAGPRDRLIEELLEAGASEAWLTPVFGRAKEGRLEVSAVTPADRRDQVAGALRKTPGAGAVRITPVEVASSTEGSSPGPDS